MLTVFLSVQALLLPLLAHLGIVVVAALLSENVSSSLPEWETSECYRGDGFQDYTDYCKYYYSKKDNVVEQFRVNKYFKQVSPIDVERVRSFFEDFEGWVKFEDYAAHYDFESECVDTADYFYIENDGYASYDVYLFDTQTSILYFIHSNT